MFHESEWLEEMTRGVGAVAFRAPKNGTRTERAREALKFLARYFPFDSSKDGSTVCGHSLDSYFRSSCGWLIKSKCFRYLRDVRNLFVKRHERMAYSSAMLWAALIYPVSSGDQAVPPAGSEHARTLQTLLPSLFAHVSAVISRVPVARLLESVYSWKKKLVLENEEAVYASFTDYRESLLELMSRLEDETMVVKDVVENIDAMYAPGPNWSLSSLTRHIRKTEKAKSTKATRPPLATRTTTTTAVSSQEEKEKEKKKKEEKEMEKEKKEEKEMEKEKNATQSACEEVGLDISASPLPSTSNEEKDEKEEEEDDEGEEDKEKEIEEQEEEDEEDEGTFDTAEATVFLKLALEDLARAISDVATALQKLEWAQLHGSLAMDPALVSRVRDGSAGLLRSTFVGALKAPENFLSLEAAPLTAGSGEANLAGDPGLCLPDVCVLFNQLERLQRATNVYDWYDEFASAGCSEWHTAKAPRKRKSIINQEAEDAAEEQAAATRDVSTRCRFVAAVSHLEKYGFVKVAAAGQQIQRQMFAWNDE
jgi:hypothetical protein